VLAALTLSLCLYYNTDLKKINRFTIKYMKSKKYTNYWTKPSSEQMLFKILSDLFIINLKFLINKKFIRCSIHSKEVKKKSQ
jgi:hypothetical protein